jgi:hypothetical protein
MGGLAKAKSLDEPLCSQAIAEWHRRHDEPRRRVLAHHHLDDGDAG